MGEKLDKVIEKIGAMLDTWIDEFSTDPIKTTVKVLVILYVIKYAKKVLK